MNTEPSPRPWRVGENSLGWKTCIVDANGNDVASCWGGEGINSAEPAQADAALIVDSVNWFSEEQRDAMIETTKERDKLKAESDRLRTAYADLWRAVKRIEADSRLGLGTGLEVASSALHYVHTYASSAIRAAEKKGFAP